MRTYALVNDNTVSEIISLEDSYVEQASARCSLLIDIEDLMPRPDIGWKLVGNKLEAFTTLSQEDLEIALAAQKMKSGIAVASKAIAKVGARNKMLGKTAQQITTLLTTLSGVRALLETGALGTARDIISQVKAGYPEYADIFDESIGEINDFESKYGL